MNYSERGLQLTEQFESCELTAYRDIVGVLTIGYGHTSGVKEGDTCTQAQAEAWLLEDVQSAVNAVTKWVTVTLNQNQFDALVDFVFNLGEGALEHSTLLKLLNQGDYQAASKQFPLWDHAGGKPNTGLLKRRQQEEALFNENLSVSSV